MKKIAAIVLASVMMLSTLALASCGKSGNDNNSTTTTASSNVTTSGTNNGTTTNATVTGSATGSATASATGSATNAQNVMSYEEYMAAELDSDVVVETYVQAKQSWWENKATIYAQGADGAYFIYNAVCSEEDYAKLNKGVKIRVSGTKISWEGEVEISDATLEILEGSYEATALDVTSLLSNADELIKHQNELVAFKGMKVEPIKNEAGDECAFLYKHNGSGTEGDDLYFQVSSNGVVYTFTVESYLCGKDTDVYKAVQNFKVGDVVDMEGFLYWYNGANPHITSVVSAAN